MKKDYLCFYISSHGFGHLTRCLALIQYILNNTNYNIYICTDIKQIDFAKIYLINYSNRLIFSVQKTDVGLINKKNSLQVDVKKTNKEVKKLLSSYKTILNEEINNLKSINPVLIISDISILGFLVGNELKIKVIGIANFTWVDQYLSIGLDTEIIKYFKNIYSTGTAFIKYDLSLKFQGAPKNKIITTDSLVSRPINIKRVNDIKKYCNELFTKKTKKQFSPEIIFLSLGMSAQLPQINISNFEGVIIYTDGVEFSRELQGKSIALLKLPLEIKDSQSYVAAADYAIAKAGWSTTAESLVGHTKLTLINREGVDDDMNTINILKSRHLVNSININNLIDLDYNKFKLSVKQNIDADKLLHIHNNIDKICDLLLSFI